MTELLQPKHPEGVVLRGEDGRAERKRDDEGTDE